MMTRHGITNPTRKKNFFGDDPFFFKIVQLNVASSSPRRPHTSKRGGSWRGKERNLLKILSNEKSIEIFTIIAKLMDQTRNSCKVM